MADTISSDRRSKIMSHIKSKDTSIEMMVRRRLFAMGYRYRVNYKALPGKPDIVFTKKKIAIFLGWKVVVLWECQIKLDFENTIQKLLKILSSKDRGEK